jgi:hypothetical protein
MYLEQYPNPINASISSRPCGNPITGSVLCLSNKEQHEQKTDKEVIY